jgi:hypothetical protein
MSRDDDYEIIPPKRALALRSMRPAPVRPEPLRADTGGVFASIPTRWKANSDARTYDAFTRRGHAQRALVEADTALGHSLIANARMRHEFGELPAILATDRAQRQLGRQEELRTLRHQAELSEMRRIAEMSDAEEGLTHSRTRVVAAHEQLIAARRGLLNAEQEMDAQREYGPRYHALGWEQRLGDQELSVAEQAAVLAEHRKRVALAEDEKSAAEDELIQRRADLNADGADTRDVDAEIDRVRRRLK